MMIGLTTSISRSLIHTPQQLSSSTPHPTSDHDFYTPMSGRYPTLHASLYTLNRWTISTTARQFIYSQSLDNIQLCTLVHVLSVTGRHPPLHAGSFTLNHWTIFNSARQFMYSQSLYGIPLCTLVYVLSITGRYSTVHSTFGIHNDCTIATAYPAFCTE